MSAELGSPAMQREEACCLEELEGSLRFELVRKDLRCVVIDSKDLIGSLKCLAY